MLRRMDIFTIGHSNHDLETFLGLLQAHDITAVADVRSHPYSRYRPDFNQPILSTVLRNHQIHYVFLGEALGAMPSDLDCYVNGRASYARIAATKAFQSGIERLKIGAGQHRIALMCAEKDPINCHRAILVCPHLCQAGLQPKHILADSRLELHADLEDRLLAIHKLLPQSTPIQLSLFAVDNIESSRDDLLQTAYRQQGDRLAAIEPEEINETID
jgi:uncharacterized protein (DUF488 family)